MQINLRLAIMENHLQVIEQKLDLLLEKKKIGFRPPSIDEITEYCYTQKLTNIQPTEFYDFYESKGWMIGKNKMKNWQAAVRNWEKRNKPSSLLVL